MQVTYTFLIFSKPMCRMITHRFVSESIVHGLSLECFPIDFGCFFSRFYDFLKNDGVFDSS